MRAIMVNAPNHRPPSWYGVPVRVLLITFLGTLITFAASLFIAILGTIMVAAVRGVHPDMRIAYRHIALPAALAAGAIVFVLAWILEIRHYRANQALSAIERIS